MIGRLMFKSTLIVLLIAFCQMSEASFNIDYGNASSQSSSAAAEPARPTKKLLLDNSIQWLTIQGTCESNRIIGDSPGVSLPMAIRTILPPGWRVYADEGLSLDSVEVSWADGELWTKAIGRAAEIHRVKVEINCLDKTVTFHPSPALGVYSVGNNIEAIGDLAPPIQSTKQQASVEVQGTVQSPKVQQANTVSSFHNEPYANETIQNYLNRYSQSQGFDRVVFDIKTHNLTEIIRSQISVEDSKNGFELEKSLAKKGLVIASARDMISNQSALVLSDNSGVKNHELFVFPVNEGMLSNNAIKLASAWGWTIAKNQEQQSYDDKLWPLDVDYRIPFDYDIVMADAFEGFQALFAKYPIQAQLVPSRKTLFVVKRNSANR